MDMYQKRKMRQEKNNSESNQESFPKVSISWYPGHMAKTKKQLIQELKLIDVVIEILDARIPISSRNPDINEISQNKKRIILLNKSDLAEEKENQRWIQHFKNQGITAIQTNSNSGNGLDIVVKTIQNIMQDELERYNKKGIVNKTIRVAIVGIPNVGKSSFINKVSKKTSANVGNKPGVTKKNQWIRLANNIELLDTPGVLWPKFNDEVGKNLAYTGSIKEEILDRVELAYSLVKKLYEENYEMLKQRYKITEEEKIEVENDQNQAYKLMQIIAKKRGAIMSGGLPDDEKVARLILDEFKNGKLGRITLEKC